MMVMNLKVAIIGAGVSGVAASIALAQRKIDVCLYEGLSQPLKKLLATGNGHANLSNKNLDKMFYSNEEFALNILNRIGHKEIVDFFKSIGLPVRFDNEGRIYPFSFEAKAVYDTLLAMVNHLNIPIRLNKNISNVSFNGKFIIENEEYDYLILACGGNSQVAFNGYSLAKDLGHHITSLKPSLVGMKSNDLIIKNTQGLRVKATVKFKEFEEFGEIQFKNDGISGIVIFNLVSYINKYNYHNPTIYVDFISDDSLVDIIFTQDWKFVDTAFNGLINHKLMKNILSNLKITKKYIKDLSPIDKKKIKDILHNCPITLNEPYGFEQSQVTSGGVDLLEVNSNMQSKINNKLFLTGEILDIDGRCGGYNLHMAFATGLLAGGAIYDIISKH